MDRRTVLFIVLSLGIWYGWLVMFPPPEPPEGTEGSPETTQTTGSDTPTGSETPSGTDTPAPVAPVAPVLPTIAAQTRPMQKCRSSSTWSSDGGSFSDLTLQDFKAPYHVTPLYSWVLSAFDGPWSPYGEDPGPAVVLTPAARAFAAGVGDAGSAPVALAPVDGWGGSGRVGSIEIAQSVVPVQESDETPCHMVASYTWTNRGSEAFAGPVWISAHDALPEGGGGMMARYSSQAAASALINGGVWTLNGDSELTAPKLVKEGPVGWFGMADRYFAAYLVPEEPHGAVYQTRSQRNGLPLDGLHWMVDVDLQPGQSHTERLKLYIGPKDLDVLRAVDDELGLAVELGWFSFFARPLLWMLKLFHTAVGNWGLSIILLTFTVKIVFFPLTQTAFKSGQAMQSIQPMLKEIRETYADDQEELNRRTMELFRENKVNPLGGCLPMLIQFPVWIALYNVLLSSIELYQTEFLYLRDLSSADPYGILPIIVVGLIMLQQQFTPMGNMDPAQARMMKFMPLMFGIFFFTFPSGLVVYIFVNTVLSVLQQWFIKRTYASPSDQSPTEGAVATAEK